MNSSRRNLSCPKVGLHENKQTHGMIMNYVIIFPQGLWHEPQSGWGYQTPASWSCAKTIFKGDCG